MNYPLLSEYIEAIKAAEENFAQLKHLRPVLGDDEQPVMSSGNFAVVFKMKDEQTGKLYAVKCFLKEQEGRAEAYRLIAEELEYVSSTFLTPIKYLDKELFVDTGQATETEFPVLLMDWVEGQTLDKYIRDHIDDHYELSLLAYQFSRLAMWLMPQSFAHGDLKPDNILVKDDGTLVLVDYDGMYVPSMKGQRARELGSPDFRHPSRTEDVFDEHIDDFSLVSILLSLKAISLQPNLLGQYGASDRLLFSANDYRNLSESQVMDTIKTMMQDAELATLYSLFILSSAQNNLSQASFRLLNLKRPQVPIPKNINGYWWYIKKTGTWTDEYGVKYSIDKKFLVSAPNDIKEYTIRQGTKYVASNAFINCRELCSISLPDTVEVIGNIAFEYCVKLSSVTIPNSVKEVGLGAFSGCFSLASIMVDKDNIVYDSRNNCNAIIETLSNTLIAGCSTTVIPNSVTKIGNSAFNHCNTLKLLIIPESIQEIDDYAFSECYYLEKIFIPKSVKRIGNKAFDRCQSLSSVTISDGVEEIGSWTFAGCISITSIILPKSVNNIGKDVFLYCEKLASLHIPCGEMVKFMSLLPKYKDILVEQEDDKILSTEVTDDDLANAWTDDYGVKYSSDKKRLLSLPDDIELNDYYVREDTLVICDYAFCNKKDIKFISLPQSVIKIGYAAFSGCEYLSVNIPDKISTIGEEAFLGCSQLKYVHIPNTVEQIGDGAFAYCKRLSSIVVDKNNKKFDSRNNCNAIIEKDSGVLISGSFNTIIPNGISKIGPYAFSGCSNLLSISLPNSIVEIDNNAFSGCSGLKTIYIPESIAIIGENAFRGCSGVTSIIVERNNKRYDSRYNCNAIIDSTSNSLLFGCLNSVISDDVEKLEDFAFSGCCGLKKIAIPQGVQEIGNGVFDKCHNLESIDISESVKKIGKWAFRNCRNLTSINLPASLAEIGEFAFNKCEKLQSIIIPNGIDKISNWLFDGCSSLCTIEIPISIKEIGFAAFKNCVSLPSIAIPESVHEIGSHAFEGCYSLSSLIIPKNVAKIGDGAFSGCSHIESIAIPDSVLYLGGGAFKDCASLSSVILPNNITRIEYQLFYGCKQLNSISIPPKVTDISMNAFSFCSLTSIFIPKSVSSINYRGFMGCSKIESIIVEEGCSCYDSRNNCNAIIETNNNKLIKGCSKTIIPDTVITIGKSAFSDCFKLKSINIPYSIKTIEDYAFGITLKTLIINNDVIDIEKNALFKCKNLQAIHIPSGSRQRFEKMLPDYKDILIEQDLERVISTEVTDEGSKNAWTDEYGVKYSADKKRLLSVPLNITNYIIRGGTEIIEDEAFKNHFVLFDITIPYTIKQIGNRAFWGCSNLGKISLPAYVTHLGTQVFDGCRNLSKILVPMGTMQKYEILLSDYKDKLVEIDNGWKIKNMRSFTADEASAVVLAKVVPSQYGLSVQFDMVSGLTTYIPLSTQSNLNVDDVIDIVSAKLITLSRDGDEDIYRVLE